MTLPTNRSVGLAAPPEDGGDTVTQLMSAFTRYAGWLGSNQPSSTLRTHAQGLEQAVDARTDAWTWIALLDLDLKRLPSGEIPKMLKRTLTQIAAALEAADRAHVPGPRP